MKLRTYSLLLTLFCSLLYIQVSAQSADSLKALDSMIEKTRRNLELNSQELRDLQRKKARLNQNRDSERMNADRDDSDRRGKNSVSAWFKNFNLDVKIDNQVEALKGLNIDLKLNDLLNDLDIRSNNDYRDNNAQRTDRTKTISKSYPVTKEDKLRISNKYGKVTINTWAKNEIKVDVEIKVTGSSDNRAQELLDKIHINESKQGRLVSFETEFDQINLVNRSGERREVNYVVYMPSGNALEINHSYGNSTIISDFNGAVTIRQSYGNFSASDLTNSSNTINAKYGNVTVGDLKSGILDISYGNLRLAKAGKLDAKISYSPIRIERISGDLDLDLRYAGELRIGKVDPFVKNININADYSSMSLGFDPEANFNFDVAGNHTSFNYDKSRVTSIISTSRNGGKSTYIGRYGKESDVRVTINASYGNVKFLQ